MQIRNIFKKKDHEYAKISAQDTDDTSDDDDVLTDAQPEMISGNNIGLTSLPIFNKHSKKVFIFISKIIGLFFLIILFGVFLLKYHTFINNKHNNNYDITNNDISNDNKILANSAKKANYYEITGDLDLHSMINGKKIPNCVDPGTFTNNDLSNGDDTNPIAECNTVNNAGVNEQDIDIPGGYYFGAGQVSIPFGAKSLSMNQYRQIRGAIGTTLADNALMAQRHTLILDENNENNKDISRRLLRRLTIDNEIRGKPDTWYIKQNKIPSTKFNEIFVNSGELFKKNYIFDIPYSSIDIILKEKNNINNNIINKLEARVTLGNTIINDNSNNINHIKKYVKYCNDLSFFEHSSEFIFNTKVYMPDKNKDIKGGCNSYMAKATYDAQKYIYKTQNYYNGIKDNQKRCNNKEIHDKLFYPISSEHGIGAQITLWGYNMAYSISKGYKMVTPYITRYHVSESLNKFQEFCDTKSNNISYNCYLKDMTICNNYKPYQYLNDDPKTDFFQPHIKLPPNNLFKYDMGEVYWLSQLLKYILRPSKKLNELINKFKKELNFNKLRNEGMIGIHIRHGDVCSKTTHRWMRKCNTLDEYMFYVDKMSSLYGYKNIYITTDDDNIINEINKYKIENPTNKYTFIYNNIDRKQYNSESWIEYRSDLDYNKVYYEALVDIIMLSECSALVGTFSSNISRVAYLLMIANSGGYKPFASMDTAFCMINRGGFPC